MSRDNKKIGLNPGLKAAGPVLSRAEAQVLAEAKNKTVDQVMSRALDKGVALGSALVNSYNRGAFGPSPTTFGYDPGNLAPLGGLQLEKGQVYAGSSTTTTPAVSTRSPQAGASYTPESTTYNPIVLPRQAVRGGYNPTVSPGGSTTPLVPGLAINPATNEGPVPGQVPAAPATATQAENIENLKSSVRTRAEKMASFEQVLKDAEDKTRQLRADRATAKATRQAERDAAQQAERTRLADEEAAFMSRLKTTADEYASQRQSNTITPEADRQARMIDEFEQARRTINKDKRYDMDRFRDRFGDIPAPVAAPAAEGTEETGTSPVTYQELLDRLKQYRRGGF